MTIWGTSEHTPNLRRVGLRIITNPIILGCLAGLAANLAGAFQSGPVADTLDLAGRASLPLILLTIGAGLDFTSLRARPGIISLSVTAKLIIAPAVFYALGILLGVEGVALAVLVGIGATPGAAAAYVLAREMGGDAEMMAGHVTATTLLAAVTLPIWIAIAAL